MNQPIFWSDQIAFGITRKFPDRDTYVCASGITPSGRVHIGNFREIITTDFVVKSLEERGEDTRFIYSWDDYDRFRKVPDNVPDEWEQYIGLPVAKVPDPWDCHRSYADHFESELEDELRDFHMDIEFIRQSRMYQQCSYTDGIKKALQQRETIRKILDKHRSSPLSEDWMPVRVYCTECQKDNTDVRSYDGGTTITYYCKDCDEEQSVDFAKDDSVKLQWRVDWPMRWDYENVAFEPGGKDHSASGSSRDTGKEIVKEIYDADPPVYQMYDFVSLKGMKGKMSSSSGETVTLTELRDIYTPEMIRFLFSETKPRKEFDIAVDETLLQRYNKFDRIEDAYFNPESVDDDKQREHWKRVYELAMVEIPDEQPVRPPFDHLAMLAQTYPKDEWASEALDSLRNTGHIEGALTDEQKLRVLQRMKKAAAWADEYAPDKYRYEIHDSVGEDVRQQFDRDERALLIDLATKMRSESFGSVDELDDFLFDFQDRYDVGTGRFFSIAYLCILGREQGPRLSRLIAAIGTERTASILESV